MLVSRSFTINGTTFPTMHGHVHAGDTVVSTFTAQQNRTVTVSLASYHAPSADFSRETASRQVLVDRQTGTVHRWNACAHGQRAGMLLSGGHGLWYSITQFGPADSDNFYSDQDRLIEGVNGGGTS